MKRCQQQIAAIAAAAPAADGVEQLPFLSRNLPASTWEHPDARKLLGQGQYAHPLLSATTSFESSMRNGRKRGWSTDEVPNLPSLFDDALGMEAKRTRTDGSDLSMPLAQEDSQSQLQAQAMLDDFAGAGPEPSTCPHHCPPSTPAFCLTTPLPSLQTSSSPRPPTSRRRSCEAQQSHVCSEPPSSDGSASRSCFDAHSMA